MRVKLGNRIHVCTLATHTPESRLILLTIQKEVYTVDMRISKIANDCIEQLLSLGYYDFSDFEYSN